ncbi:MAG: preprotein translocase subunit SecG [Holophagales bacterium]|nr:preprotein translocase subunit SecG [Holophagales bacterium]
MLTILVYTVHVLICFFLIAVVLLQQGKGADLSVFGGGGTQTAFGARGAATVLHKMTVGSFVAFIVTTLTIGTLQGDRESGIIGDLPEAPAVEQSAEEAPDEAEEGALEAEGALPAGDTISDGEAGEAEAASSDGEAPATGDDGSESGEADAGGADDGGGESGEGSEEAPSSAGGTTS